MPKESKQYRLESETIAEIDLYSRLQRLEYTTFVEQAILDRIRKARTETGIDSHDVARFAGQPGAVLCRLFMLAEKKVPLTWAPSEQRIREFVMRHAPFFYNANDEPRHEAMRFLWPNLEEIMKKWDTDYWAPGRAMQVIYRKNGITPPSWPPEGVSESDSEASRPEH